MTKWDLKPLETTYKLIDVINLSQIKKQQLLLHY